MTYNIALQFEDGVTQFIKCKDGEKLADAAYAQKVNIPMDCRDGACGTCRCHCESGSYDMPESSYIEDALTKDEVENGYVLSCQMKPTSDCVIKFDVNSDVCKINISNYQGVLSSLEKLTDTTFRFCIDFENASDFGFLAGQYVNIQIPTLNESRSYSMSSAPGAKTASFVVRNVPNGKMSQYLDQNAKVGDKMSFSGPYGSFYLRKITRPVLFLARGTGIAPFLSMLDAIEPSNAFPIRMVFGVKNDEDIVALDELDKHKANLSDFDYHICVANESSKAQKKGNVTEHIDDKWLNNGDVDIYVCGPVKMVDAVRDWLQEKGIEPSGFHYERFLAT